MSELTDEDLNNIFISFKTEISNNKKQSEGWEFGDKELKEFVKSALSQANEANKQHEQCSLDDVVGQSEQLVCIHEFTRLRIIGNNITCLDCGTTWKKAN